MRRDLLVRLTRAVWVMTGLSWLFHTEECPYDCTI